MAFFRKSKKEHLDNLGNMSSSTEIQEYFQTENIPLDQLDQYLENRGIQVAAEGAVNIQNNTTSSTFTIIHQYANQRREKRERANQPTEAELDRVAVAQNAKENAESATQARTAAAILLIIISAALFFIVKALIVKLTPSQETINAVVETSTTFGTVFLWVLVVFAVFGLIASVLANRPTRKPIAKSQKKSEELNETTKKFLAQRAKDEEESKVIDLTPVESDKKEA